MLSLLQSCWRSSVLFVLSALVTVSLQAQEPLVGSTTGNLTSCVGTPAMLMVTATGAEPLSYQWYKGPDLIPGATTATYTIASVLAADAGDYSIVVSNGEGTTGNVPVGTLTVNALTTVTVLPSGNVDACPGSPAAFMAIGAGTGPITYQWYKDGALLEGATASAYTIAAVVVADAGTYAVVATGACNSATNSAILTVAALPTITAAPVSANSPMGNSASFSVTASGVGPLTYAWLFNGNPLSGQTASTLTLNNLAMSQAGSYQAVVSNCRGSVTSAVATLTVTPVFGVTCKFNNPGEFLNTPYYRDTSDWVNTYLPSQVWETASGGVGNSACLDMTAGGNDNSSIFLPVTYDFSPSGRTLIVSTLVKIKAPSSNNRSTQMGFGTATNSGLNGNNGQGFMTVILQSTAQPALTYQLRQQWKPISGTTATETTPVSTTATLVAGNWYKLTGKFTNIKGTTANAYTVEATLTDMGADGQTVGAVVLSYTPTTVTVADMVNAKSLYFSIRGYENTGVDLRDDTYVTTTAGALTLVTPPASQTVVQGSLATFQAMVDGDGPYTYQWSKNGTPISGATAWKYVTPPVVPADNGATYSVTVTGATGDPVTGAGTLTVTPLTLAVVSAGSLDGVSVGVRFNQPVDKASAENRANYAINGAAPYKVTMRPDGQSVAIVPSGTLSGAFTVTVQDVQDLAGGTVGAENTVAGMVANLLTMDLNAPAQPGAAYTDKEGSFELVGNGNDIWGTADMFRYVYAQRTGDFDIRMQIPKQDVMRAASKSAFVLRELLEPASRMLFVEMNPVYPGRQYVSTGKRDAYGASANNWNLSTPTIYYPNAWLRIRRVGNTFTAYVGTNGENWTVFGQTTAVYPPTVYLGVGACAGNNANGFPHRAWMQNYSDFVGYPAATVAIAAQPTSATAAANGTATFNITAAATGITNSEVAFQWQRSDGAGGWVNVPTGNGYPNVSINAAGAANSFTTPVLYPADDGAQFRCVAMLPGGATATSDVVTVTVADSVLPTLVSATVPPSDIYQVVLVFSEPLAADSAIDPGNYSVTDGTGASLGVVSAAQFPTDPRIVVLTVDTVLVQGNFNVTVNNVQDLAGNAIAGNTGGTFSVAGTPPTQPVVVEIYLQAGPAASSGGATANLEAMKTLTRFINRQPDSIVYNSVFGFGNITATLADTGINYYGARAYTYFVPPTNGVYKFWIRSDDTAQLFMNTNAVNSTDPAGVVKIMENTGSSSSYTCGTTLANSRTNMLLVAGQKYYMEMLLKEGSGGDGFSVAYTAPATTTAPTATSVFIGGTNLAYPAEVAPATPVIVDIFEGISGTAISSLTNSANYLLNAPSTLLWVGYNNTFSYNAQLNDSTRNTYGGRMRSLFIAPSNGVYKFFVRSDDSCDLWMNTNAVNSTDPDGAVRLGGLTSWTGTYTLAGQNIALNGGQRYFMQMFFVEGSGGDGCSVAFRAQDDASVPTGGAGYGSTPELMPANLFEYSAALDSAKAGAIGVASLTPVNPTALDGQTVTFSAAVNGNRGGLGFVWLKNGVVINTANSASYTTLPLGPDDNGAVFTVLVTNTFSFATASSTLTVNADTIAPTLLSATGSPLLNALTLVFSEPLNAITAGFVGNYQISPALAIYSATMDASGTTVVLVTGPQSPNQVYTVTVNNVTDRALVGNAVALNTSKNYTAWVGTPGYVTVEIFTNISGTAVTSLTGNTKYINSLPDVVAYPTTFYFQSGVTPAIGLPTMAVSGMENYGVRMSGLFVPPSNGLYVFYIRSDDASELWMNTNGPSRTPAQIYSSSLNSPAGQDAKACLDGDVNTKYLNFDRLNTGLAIQPNRGATVVTGVQFSTANDAVERDPMTFTIEGTTGSPTAGPWTLIASGNTGLDVTRLMAGPVINFANTTPYTAYRVLFPTIRYEFQANSMQVAEVKLMDVDGNNILAGSSMVRIAQETGNTHNYDAGTGGSASPILTMRSDTQYYVEMLGKEGGGGDFFQMAWRAVDPETGLPIGGVPVTGSSPALTEAASGADFQSLGNPDTFQVSYVQIPPAATNVVEMHPLELAVVAAIVPANQALAYMWSKYDSASGKFVTLPGATTSRLFISGVPMADNGTQYRVTVMAPGHFDSFSTAISVEPDVTGPEIISVGYAGGNTIGVVFDEAINIGPNSPTLDYANYEINFSPGIVTTVTPRADGRSVILTLDPQTMIDYGMPLPMVGEFIVAGYALRNAAVGTDPEGLLTEYSEATGFASLNAQDVGSWGTNLVIITNYVANPEGGLDETYITNYVPYLTDPLRAGNTFAGGNGWYDVTAGGSDIWNTTDGLHFVSRPVNGNFDIKVRVKSLSMANTWSKAGLMARASLNGNSRNIGFMATPAAGQNLYTMQRRDSDGASCSSIYYNNPAGFPQVRPPYPDAWMRLVREVNVFTTYYSLDGVNWTYYTNMVTAPGTFPVTMYVGLAATAHDNTSTTGPMTLAEFRDLYFPEPPTIAVQPDPTVIQVPLHEASVTMSGEGDGTGTHYQWYHNGVAIPSATDTTLTLLNLTAADSGLYQLGYGNDGGEALTVPVSLTVSNAPPTSGGPIAVATTQDVPFTIPFSDLLTNAVDPEGDVVSLVGVQGVGFAPLATWTADFNSGVPEGVFLYGATAYNATPVEWIPTIDANGPDGSGSLTLTPSVTYVSGAMIISNFNGGQVMPALQASFKVRIGDGSADAADGMSFNFAPIDSLPRTWSGTCEEGVTATGLAVAIDNYPAAGPGAPSIKVRWQNALIYTNLIPKWNSPDYVTMQINLNADGKLSVLTNGVPVFSNLQIPGFTPFAGEFGFYGRTGGQNQTHWLDDISLTVMDPNVLQTVNGGTVTLTATDLTYRPGANRSGPDSFTYTITDGQVDGQVMNTVNIYVDETTPTPPTIVSYATNTTVSLGSDCQAVLPDVTATVVATDNSCCLTITQVPAAGTVIAQGDTVVTLTVTDGIGLSATAEATVTAADTTGPELTLAATAVTLQVGASCQAALTDLTAGATTTDCNGPVVLSQEPAAGTLLGLGAATVNVIATDALGNSTTGAVTVTVIDTLAPVFVNVPAAQTVMLNPSTQEAALPNVAALATAADNCGGVVITQEPASGTMVGPGATVVTLTATDGANNIATTTVTVTAVMPELRIKSVQLATDGGEPVLLLKVDAVAGIQYKVVYKDDLLGAEWTDLPDGAFSGSGEVTYTVPVAGGNRFYRVVMAF